MPKSTREIFKDADLSRPSLKQERALTVAALRELGKSRTSFVQTRGLVQPDEMSGVRDDFALGVGGQFGHDRPAPEALPRS